MAKLITWLCFNILLCYAHGASPESTLLDNAIKKNFFELKCKNAIELLQTYSGWLKNSIPTSIQATQRDISKRIAAILGRGAGFGGFAKRIATAEEASVMLNALSAAYGGSTLTTDDFQFGHPSNSQVQTHQALVWGASQAVKIQRWEQRCKDYDNKHRDVFNRYNPRFQPTHRNSPDYLPKEGIEARKPLREEEARELHQLSGGWGQFAQDYSTYWAPSGLDVGQISAHFSNAKLTGEKQITDNVLPSLWRLAASSNSILSTLFNNDAKMFSYYYRTDNIKPFAVYGGYWDSIVNIHTYNDGSGEKIASIRQDKPDFKKHDFTQAMNHDLISSNVDLDFVMTTANNMNHQELLLRPHGWLHPDAPEQGSYDKSETVFAGIYDSQDGINLEGHRKNLIPIQVYTHTSSGSRVVLSPDNARLYGFPDNHPSDALFSFFSIVKKQDFSKAVVTLHWIVGKDIREEFKKYKSHVNNVGDLFLFLHYSPYFTKNPHALRQLAQWVGD